jgi:hypothetical protein
VVIDCEGGYFAGDMSGGAFYDRQGKKIKELRDGPKPQQVEIAHMANFVAAVQSRSANSLHAEAQVGRVSAACCHMANISHRIGKQTRPAEILEVHAANRELSDAFQRCREYLRTAGVDLEATPPIVGPWVTLDPQQERFVGDFADQANALVRREYRPGFAVPETV